MPEGVMGNPGLSQEMPLQKCMRGEDVRNLSDAEILAIIIGTGSRDVPVMELASRTIGIYGGPAGMMKSGVRELSRVKGIGLVKALRIHASLEMGRRALTDRTGLTHLCTPDAVWRFLLPEMAGLEQEEFRVLVLNNKNRLLKKCMVSVGTISEALVHPREVFRDAIREGGSSIIVCHNHPSGVASPSSEDIRTTERIRDAGVLLGIPLLDHVIITDRNYSSMKEEGYL